MRRDLIIGLILSIGIHGGLGYGEKIYGMIFGPPAQKTVQHGPSVEVEIWQAPEMPEVPPDPTEAEEEQAVDVATIAPPSLMDIPGNVQVDSFTQTMAPPPPPSLGRPDGGTMTIPKGPPGGSGVKSNLGQIFNLADLDQRPTERGIRASPNYPFEMKRQGITGEVVLQFLVDPKGDVRDVTVIRSSHREFEAPAIQAVLKWKFRPGRKGGKAVTTRMQIPMSFTLNDDD